LATEFYNAHPSQANLDSIHEINKDIKKTVVQNNKTSYQTKSIADIARILGGISDKATKLKVAKDSKLRSKYKAA
jgi:hypothetical protein